MQIDFKKVKSIVAIALAEDIGNGDITSEAVIDKKLQATFSFITRQKIIVCGLKVVEEVFAQVDKSIKCELYLKDGDKAEPGKILMNVSGSVRSILLGERVALNLLQHMSGVATLTREFVDKIKDTNTKILDTRKTLPGLRVIEKYAVTAGGGQNHRMGLYDGVLIKDNHIAICGSIKKAVELLKKANLNKKIEVECDSLDQVKEAINSAADMILLDNMTTKQLSEAVKLVNKKIPLEASGSVKLSNVKEIAETGVDFISIGALTHSAPNVDIGLDQVL